MSDQRLRINSQEALTPKRFYNITYPKPIQAVFNTPDRQMKSPFRGNIMPSHSFNEVEQVRSIYPTPTYQSSQYDMAKYPYDDQQKLFQRLQNLEDELRMLKDQRYKDSKELQQYRAFYQQYYGNKSEKDLQIQQLTERNRQLEERAQKQPNQDQINKVVEMTKEQIRSLNLQLEDGKHKMNDLTNQYQDLDKKYKQTKQMLKSKDKEIHTLEDRLAAYESRSMSQQKQREFFDAQIVEFRNAYEQLALVNDEISQENTQLKIQLLQAETTSKLYSSYQSKKNSEQDFQHQNMRSLRTNEDQDQMTIIIEQFLIGKSDDLLKGADSQTIQIYQLFKSSFERILHMLQQKREIRQEEEPFRMSEVQSAEFSKNHQDDEILGMSDLLNRSNSIITQINMKKEKLLTLKNDDQFAEQLRRDIENLEREHDAIQMQMTDQSEIFNNPNPHRNSIISFNQDFDAYEDSQQY
ncbi:hypothetical protein pb186bvf_003065 [Paramecium bursaria]